ncbi:TPM domain-containing protein [Parafilimonas terrae]|uniref:TLP18.3, Psb32 and MOLO-1 founding protein of phosphatase n=1 Tax=Parafilimonas terrae TaxID=1465490 RepID=A0A1I5UZG5_9BACT|nr:TPM domain-containing protein [Parafilimonas terrae]SFQ00096.1 TLP18.3, Psb32 and MOLO-1 founding protein of phosphatase [Parafilimonas terrae]
MTRLIFAIPFLLLSISNAFGQSSNSSVLVKKFNLNLLLIKEKLVVDSLLNVYNDRSDVELNKILSDSAFIKSLVQSNAHDHDQLICSAYKIPYIIKPLGWTSDYGHIFTNNQIAGLDSMLSDYERKTKNEIAVVTFDSSFIHDEDFDSLVLAIHNFWRVGKIDANNGILIGISTAKRKIRINNGYGIEDKLSNEETKTIIDNIIVPAFKKADYFDGVKNAIKEIMNKI